MKLKSVFCWAAVLLSTANLAEDLPWVYDTSARPAEVSSEQSVTPSVALAGSSVADSAPLDYFNSYYAELFQIDGLSVLLPRYLFIYVR